MTLRNKVLLALVIVAALAVVVCVTPTLNFKRQLFQFGVLRGAEDHANGTRYSGDAPGLKMFGNSSHWTNDRKELALHFFSEPSDRMSGNVDAFMAGYDFGVNWFKYLFGLIAVLLFLKRLQPRAIPQEHSDPDAEIGQEAKQE